MKDEIKRLFQKWDKNNDGWISRDELERVFVELEADMSKAELQLMFNAADRDRNGKIDIDEFVEWIYSGGQGTDVALAAASPETFCTPSMAEISAAFSRIDLDGDGVIDMDELWLVFSTLGNPIWTDERLKQLFKSIDTNKVGRIQQDEFASWILKEADGEALQLRQDLCHAITHDLCDVGDAESSENEDAGDRGEAVAAEKDKGYEESSTKRERADLLTVLHDLAKVGMAPAMLRCLEPKDIEKLLTAIVMEDSPATRRIIKAGVASMGQKESGQSQQGAGAIPGVRDVCQRGHALSQEPCKAWGYCDECGYRPNPWYGGPDRIPYLECARCDFSLCGDCSGLAKAMAPATPSAEQTAWTTLKQLADEARGDPSVLFPNAKFNACTEAGGKSVELQAFVVGPVVRQVVPQGDLCVCGAAATAGALNACTEQLKLKKNRLHLSWKNVLFGHFRDKLHLKVVDSDGDPASWKVGKPHIRQVIESFPGMRTRDLILPGNAEKKSRAAAWQSLVTELHKPNTAVYFHTRTPQFGHYTLIAGAVGLSSKHGCLPTQFDKLHSAVLTNQCAQEPEQRVPFEKICEQMVKPKSFTQIFAVEYKK